MFGINKAYAAEESLRPSCIVALWACGYGSAGLHIPAATMASTTILEDLRCEAMLGDSAMLRTNCPTIARRCLVDSPNWPDFSNSTEKCAIPHEANYSGTTARARNACTLPSATRVAPESQRFHQPELLYLTSGPIELGLILVVTGNGVRNPDVKVLHATRSLTICARYMRS